ncbi:hypothetical protein [Arcobacter cloacae]|uniref:Uncharacterized protein n=1 Tax=Arcobacter cloacae TaxID=1054034 RepID=A0A6M8NII9_9BACT|nr:hypothetical protein [Arcobacter cloacae]QKF91185.1 putative membrane protein [Arcobacter cloacae]RXI40440.1 hypothetical protein CP963_08600 [Arcobacter cloacae]
MDIKLLIISTFFSLSILLLTSIISCYKLPEKNYPKCFLLFSIFFLLGQLLTTYRNVLPDLLSIVFGNLLLVIGYIFLYIGIRDLLNLNAQWNNRYLIPIGVMCIGFILFTYINYNLAMRIVIFSIFCVIYGLIIAWLFFKNKNNGFEKFNTISAFLFLIGVILFLIRTFKASTIKIHGNYLSTTDLMISLVYGYLLIMTIWLTILLTKYSNHITFSKSKNNK